MKGGNKVHARVSEDSEEAMCTASSPYGLMFGTRTFKDGGPDLSVDCLVCLRLIDEENKLHRAGVAA